MAAGRRGDCATALADLKPLVTNGLSSPQALNVIAVCESRTGNPEGARDYFERIVKMEPDVWQAWNNLGGNDLTLNRPSEAASAFHRAIQLNPANASVWFNQASALLKLGRPEEAFESLDHAERLAPEDPQIRKAWLGVAGSLASQAADLINKGQYAKAQRLLLATERPLENSAYWNNLLGYAEFKLNRPKPALEHLQKALQLDPDNTDFLMDVGEFLAHYRAYREALEMFQVAAKRLPKSPQVQFGLAVSYILENRREEATRLLEALIAWNPKFEPAYRALGECYEDAGRGKAMVELGRRLQAIDSSNPTGWYLEGAGLLNESVQNQNLLTSAIPALERAVALAPRSSRDHFILGKAYEAERDYPKAIAELKETIRLDPKHERAHYVLAQIYERMGEKQLAQAQFEAHNRIKKGERNAQYRLLLTRAPVQ
jgi:tetratricopeptide (TPR) repeat protein